MRRATAVRLLGLAALAGLGAAACVTGPPAGAPTEERLRARIERLNAYFTKGDFEGFVSMHSAGQKRHFEGMAPKQLERAKRDARSFAASARPRRELVGLEVDGRAARAAVRISLLDGAGPPINDLRYDYWVFENQDWYFDHSSF
jgi:hypothetical protein